MDETAGFSARNALMEAQGVVGEGFAARVLEPSPPAVLDGDWFADDPVAQAAPAAAPVVSPVPGADLTWDSWLRDRPQHATWAAARWLGAYRRLPPPPESLPETRLALHRLAVYVVSPARRRANGKIALRWTFGGIGTPFFGADEQVRIVGTRLVRQQDGHARVEPLTTLTAAAALVLDGPPDVTWAEPFDVPPLGDPDEHLAVDAAGAAFLGDWYGFATSVLEELRSDPESTDKSRVQVWPEHFDAAFDSLAGERRAGFGASPGDAAVGEPYLYVAPFDFDAVPASDVWNAETFRGAVHPFSEFVDSADQRADALAFFRRCRDVLRADGS
ncbi:MAG TPA: hypothetical protein VE623_20745 [Acidimicrobiales bacterium]|nr:hypothetical protein [Acidimicrobiales bacterium]